MISVLNEIKTNYAEPSKQYDCDYRTVTTSPYQKAKKK